MEKFKSKYPTEEEIKEKIVAYLNSLAEEFSSGRIVFHSIQTDLEIRDYSINNISNTQHTGKRSVTISFYSKG